MIVKVDAMVRYGEVEDVALQGCGALCKVPRRTAVPAHASLH